MNARGWIVLGGLLAAVLAGVYFGSGLFSSLPPGLPDAGHSTSAKEPPEGDPAREDHKALGDVELANYLPPPSERKDLDPGTQGAIELLETWCQQDKQAAWPSSVAVLGDRRFSAERRELQVAFVKTLRVRVTAVVGEPPAIELAAENGGRPLTVQLGDHSRTARRPYPDITSVCRAFESVERLRQVQFVATGEPLLDLIDLETGVASVRRTELQAASSRGAEFRVTLQSPTHVLTLRPKGATWQIQRIAPGS